MSAPPIDQATLDFLTVPAAGAAEGRTQQLYAVLARNQLLEARVREFDDAGIPLAVIDIPDTAQRNIAADPTRSGGAGAFSRVAGRLRGLFREFF